MPQPMNEFEQCISEWADRCRERDVEIVSLREALAQASNRLLDYERSWKALAEYEITHTEGRGVGLETCIHILGCQVRVKTKELAQAEQAVAQLTGDVGAKEWALANTQAQLQASEQQVAWLREALEAITRRAPTMGANGEYRDGQLSALEACRKVAQAALAPEAGKEKG